MQVVHCAMGNTCPIDFELSGRNCSLYNKGSPSVYLNYKTLFVSAKLYNCFISLLSRSFWVYQWGNLAFVYYWSESLYINLILKPRIIILNLLFRSLQISYFKLERLVGLEKFANGNERAAMFDIPLCPTDLSLAMWNPPPNESYWSQTLSHCTLMCFYLVSNAGRWAAAVT